MNFVILFFLFLCFPSEAAVSSFEDALIDICYIFNEVKSVRVDLDRVILYRAGSRGFWEDESEKALVVLDSIKRRIGKIGDLPGLKAVRISLIRYVNSLEAFGKKFNDGFSPDIKNCYGLLDLKETDAQEKLSKFIDEKGFLSVGFDDRDPLDEEYRMFPSQNVQNDFSKAVALLEERKFDSAYWSFVLLRRKVRDAGTQGSIIWRMARSLVKDNEGAVNNKKERLAIDLMEAFLNRQVYSPVLYDIFVFWRLLRQSSYYGWNRDVRIPGLFYLTFSRKTADTIREWIAVHPDDCWARTQLFLLASLPVLTREGAVYF